MPCATVHLHLADRVLSRWERNPAAAPFSVGDPSLRDAFLHGSLAPDMGFVPGVDRFLSELAHYIDPADLTRSLIRGASTPEESAFAWGWASHVVGDVVLHPMVGRAVGERIHGNRDVRMDADEDLPTHVAMEVGLDLALLDRVRAIPPPPPAPFLRRTNVAFLLGSLRATYGLSWKSGPVLAGHRRAVWLTTFWPRAIRLAGSRPTSGGLFGRAATAAVRAVGRVGHRLAGARSAARGFLGPLDPPDWLLERVWSSADEVAESLERMIRDGPDTLKNRNLETGEKAGAGRGHAASDKVARELERRRGEAAASNGRGGRPVAGSSPGSGGPGEEGIL